MPAGRRPKPIELHKMQGTYRPDRHGPRQPNEVERRFHETATYRCHFCGGAWANDRPLAESLDGRYYICPACVEGAMLVFQRKGYVFGAEYPGGDGA